MSRGVTEQAGGQGRRRAAHRRIRAAGPLPPLLAVALVAAASWVACSPRSAAEPAATAPELVSDVAFPTEWRYPAGRAPTAARRGMVVSTDSLASEAGLEILRRGGNAVDAAIAVHFALAAVHPQAGNLGGGGFMVVRTAEGEAAALDFREKAPAAATRDMYLDERGDLTDASWTGHLASGVPGSVAGMQAAHARFGSLPWSRLLEPAIRLARGAPMDRELHESLEGAAGRLRGFASTAEVFYRGDEPVPVGATFRQPDLARTLSAIATGGARAFYTGWIADSIAAEMTRGGGLIDRSDLAGYEAVWRRPVVTRYRDRRIISMPPPSSGGVTMGELLRVVEGFELAAEGWHSADAIHLMVEAMRRAYADRNRFLGDPDYVSMPLERLLSDAYADSLRATIDPRRASRSDLGVPTVGERPETTHFSVVDEAGDAVAVTTTLNGSFGSGVVVRGAGFLLNNEMDDFAAKPGFPNAYGLVQGEANAIEPGKRMLSSMTPTIVVGPDGRTELVTGTPGGATIITTVFQIVTNHVDYGLPVTTSVDAPRFHHQNLPDVIRFERGGLPPVVAAELRRRGHVVEERRGTSGDVQSIFIAADGTRYGASDPRGGGAALGY